MDSIDIDELFEEKYVPDPTMKVSAISSTGTFNITFNQPMLAPSSNSSLSQDFYSRVFKVEVLSDQVDDI